MRMFESRPFVVLVAWLVSSFLVHVQAIGSGRTTKLDPFRYSEHDLESCVREFESKEKRIESIVGVVGNHSNDDSFAGSCLNLYKQFLKHHHRDSSLLDESTSSSFLSSPGYTHFTKSAQLVHQHNKNYPNSGFKLRLNQFAGTSRSHTKPKTRSSSPQQHHVKEEEDVAENKKLRNNRIHKRKSSSDGYNSWQMNLLNFWEDHTKDTTTTTTTTDDASEKDRNDQRRMFRWNGEDVRLLDTHSSSRIENVYHETADPQQQQISQLQQSREFREHQSQQQQHEHKQERPKSQKHDDIHRNLKWKASHNDSPELSSILRVVASSNDKTIKVLMPGDGTNAPQPFSSPQVPSSIHGIVVKLHQDHGTTNFDNHQAQHKFSKSLDWSTTHNPDGVPLVHRVYDQGNCGSCWAFAATGSLEASAARNAARDHFVTGLTKLQEQIDDDDQNNDDDDASYLDNLGYYNAKLKDLTDESRAIESETFEILNLSIQELLDCDTSVNEGCVGGSPLLAFPYIHKHGLVSWKEHPYVGYGRVEDDDPEKVTTMATTTRLGYRDDTFPTIVVEEPGKMTKEKINPFEGSSLSTLSKENTKHRPSEPTCKTEQNAAAMNPIATVESWGLLHKNHEDLIEYALLYVGPVAVGINGADPSFINYGGGIYDSENCDQTADHALLIVGYGEEEGTNRGDNNKTSVRYWLARNSWGESWGEDGFVRVKRGSGEKGVPGVCGIARSPSVALGGIYRSNQTVPWTMKNDENNVARYRKDKYITSFDPTVSYYELRTSHPFCDSMFNEKRIHLFNGCVQCSNIYKNQPLFLALICLVCALVAITPLTVSMLRQHRAAFGSRSIYSIFVEEDQLEPSVERSCSSFTISERSHLLTLKDFYADARNQEEETRRPRGRSIVMTSPDHDPFHLVPSATFDSSEDTDKIANEEVN